MKTYVWNQLDKTEKQMLMQRTQQSTHKAVRQQVTRIIERVRHEGDAALKALTAQFDHVELDCFKVSEEAFIHAESALPKSKQHAILQAAENIRHYHEQQHPEKLKEGHVQHACWREYRPIERVGLYIPGGSAPLVSTVLMLGIPAAVAACGRRIMVTPPQRDGTVAPAILFAAHHCGIREVYKIGGAQAIAALAYGTDSIPKVDKIFGPGNAFVTEAKQQVSNDPFGAALDMPAGPSEVLVIADENANPAFIASDLLAQAEHDPASQVVLVTMCAEIINPVMQALDQQTKELSRATIITKALENSFVVLTENLEESFHVSNLYAPEHLILHLENAANYTSLVQHAGSVFLGAWTPEAVGDYASGTNHVLPTYGYARAYSGLGVEAFMKSTSFQELSEEGLKKLGPVVESLAELEGLDAHKQSVSIRLSALAKSEEEEKRRRVEWSA